MNDARIGVICASKGRINSLGRLLWSLESRTARHDLTTFWFHCEQGDDDTLALLRAFRSITGINASVLVSPHSDMIARDYWNRLASEAFKVCDFVMLLNDDTFIVTDQWDDILRKRLASDCPKDGAVYVGIEDGTPLPPNMNLKSPPYTSFPMLSKRAWDLNGFGFFHPSLACWGTDVTLYQLWSHPRVNRTLAIPEVEVAHVCHHNRTAEQDETNRIVERNFNPMEFDRVCREDIPAQAERIGGQLR